MKQNKTPSKRCNRKKNAHFLYRFLKNKIIIIGHEMLCFFLLLFYANSFICLITCAMVQCTTCWSRNCLQNNLWNLFHPHPIPFSHWSYSSYLSFDFRFDVMAMTNITTASIEHSSRAHYYGHCFFLLLLPLYFRRWFCCVTFFFLHLFNRLSVYFYV